jgi:hypothetical protein
LSRWTPCKRRDFIIKIKKLGFDGPYSGARRQFMVYRTYRLALPSNSEYSAPQLKMMLDEIESIIGEAISIDEWINL